MPKSSLTACLMYFKRLVIRNSKIVSKKTIAIVENYFLQVYFGHPLTRTIESILGIYNYTNFQLVTVTNF
jgi:hypothetical protein